MWLVFETTCTPVCVCTGKSGLENADNDGVEHVARGWADIRGGTEANPGTHGEGLVPSLFTYLRLPGPAGQSAAQAAPLLTTPPAPPTQCAVTSMWRLTANHHWSSPRHCRGFSCNCYTGTGCSHVCMCVCASMPCVHARVSVCMCGCEGVLWVTSYVSLKLIVLSAMQFSL